MKCHISDFGMASKVQPEPIEAEGMWPTGWMPPESLTEGIFSEKSDVVS